MVEALVVSCSTKCTCIQSVIERIPQIQLSHSAQCLSLCDRSIYREYEDIFFGNLTESTITDSAHK